MQKKMKELTLQEAFNKAAACCSRMECCPADIQKKLERWGLDAEARKETIDRLYAERFIDEERYSRSFAHDKLRYNQWGRIKIAQSLRLKGIPETACRAALDALDEQEYNECLRKLLRNKSRQIKAESEYERNGKLIRFALSHGFEMSLITRCLHVEEKDYT